MNQEPLEVDTNFYKNVKSADDTAKAPSYVHAAKRLDKSILAVNYEVKTSKCVSIVDIGSILM